MLDRERYTIKRERLRESNDKKREVEGWRGDC